MNMNKKMTFFSVISLCMGISLLTVSVASTGESLKRVHGDHEKYYLNLNNSNGNKLTTSSEPDWDTSVVLTEENNEILLYFDRVYDDGTCWQVLDQWGYIGTDSDTPLNGLNNITVTFPSSEIGKTITFYYGNDNNLANITSKTIESTELVFNFNNVLPDYFEIDNYENADEVQLKINSVKLEYQCVSYAKGLYIDYEPGPYGYAGAYIGENEVCSGIEGTQVSLIATPSENCEFLGWYKGSSGQYKEDESPVFISTNPQLDYVIDFDDLDPDDDVIYFTGIFMGPVRLLISAIDGGEGSYTKNYINDEYSSSLSCKPGDEVTVKTHTNLENPANSPGRTNFLGWYLDDLTTLLSTDQEFTLTIPYVEPNALGERQYRIIAKYEWFTKNSIYVESPFPEMGSAVIDTFYTHMVPGETVRIIATPNPGYQFVGWYHNYFEAQDMWLELLSEEATYEFLMPDTHVQFSARFEPITE